MDRRTVLKTSFGALSALAGSGILARTVQAACRLTPPQMEGPFYPVSDQLDKDTDLTRVRGRQGTAIGEKVYVRGQILDQACNPVPGVLVEIWQACASGRYNHPNDPNTAPLDPNFQYWGRAITDAEGRYLFKTIVPGAYPADVDWDRPPHIHFKISKRGYHELITQMYFAGHPLNPKDKILNTINPGDRSSVVVDFAESAEFERGSKVGTFNISIKKA